LYDYIHIDNRLANRKTQFFMPRGT